jgi:NAD(P)H-dependent FMN reductase
MKKIIVMNGSNNKKSINMTLAKHAFSFLNDSESMIVDLSQVFLPLYNPILEDEKGIPSEAKEVDKKIEAADGIILSLAEYNGSYSGAFKNTFDWLSRINVKVWKNKPMLLMSTSPGKGGGSHVSQTAKTAFPHYGGNIVAEFSLPSFSKNFEAGEITDDQLKSELLNQVELFQQKL